MTATTATRRSVTKTLLTVLAAATALSTAASVATAQGAPPAAPARSGYGDVKGLKIYYEIHGTGRPLVVLHGGFMNIPTLGPLIPAFVAAGRQVIAVELEGHGRTADLDRPLSYEQMADDVAGLLAQLGVRETDVFGFSMGGCTALRLAVQHPDLVRKLVVTSANIRKDGFYPSVTAMWPDMSPAGMAGTPWEAAYAETAAHPEHWAAFIEKMKTFMVNFKGWPASDIQSIRAPTLLVAADADLIQPEHTLEMFRLVGGARPDGGMAGSPASQFAILPGTTHFNIIYRTDLLVPIVTTFLDATAPAQQ